MSSWVPGFTIVEGPKQLKREQRFRGFRDSDGTPAWIRVDGYPPDDIRTALRIAKVYQATAEFDCADLPPVLEYGSTAIAGRPFIAFQYPRALRGEQAAISFDEAVEILAEITILVYERGFFGLHLPLAELRAIRAGKRVDGSRLPVREFLIEPRRSDGVPGFEDVIAPAEWHPFCAPEFATPGDRRQLSVRQGMSYRLAAQIHFICSGMTPVRQVASALFHDSGGNPDAVMPPIS